MIKAKETYILPSNLEDEIADLQVAIDRFKSAYKLILGESYNKFNALHPEILTDQY